MNILYDFLAEKARIIFTKSNYKKSRNEKSLETLLSYNIEDVLNLEYLMIIAYNQKLKDIPFAFDDISIPTPQQNPFKVDSSTVSRIKNEYYSNENSLVEDIEWRLWS